jgi:hypothetical protein
VLPLLDVVLPPPLLEDAPVVELVLELVPPLPDDAAPAPWDDAGEEHPPAAAVTATTKETRRRVATTWRDMEASERVRRAPPPTDDWYHGPEQRVEPLPQQGASHSEREFASDRQH